MNIQKPISIPKLNVKLVGVINGLIKYQVEGKVKHISVVYKKDSTILKVLYNKADYPKYYTIITENDIKDVKELIEKQIKTI